MPSSRDSAPDSPTDPFIIDPSSQPYSPGFTESPVPSLLKPYIIVFHANPFTTHDGVHGRSAPAWIRTPSQPQSAEPVWLEFQLSLDSPPSPESESDSGGDPASGLPPPDPDAMIRPGLLRYLDGDAAPLAEFSESPRAHFETTTTTRSTVPLVHPYPSRQSFPQLDSTYRSPSTFHDHSQFNDSDHPFTRIDRTPELETPSFRSTAVTYPHSLAYHAHHGASESAAMYAPESTLETGRESSHGYQYAYSSSNTSGSDGYPVTHTPAVGSHHYSQDGAYNHRAYSQSQHSFSLPSLKSNASPEHALFATPAQMAIPSRQEGIYPSANRDPSANPMSYPGGNPNPTNTHPFGHAVSPSLEPHLAADHHYAPDTVQLRDGDRRDIPVTQSNAEVRDIKFSHPPYQAPGQTRRLSLPAPHLTYSRESYFQTAPRSFDQISSRGYGQDTNGLELPASESQHGSRSSSLSVYERRGSLAYGQSVSRMGSATLDRSHSGAFSHSEAETGELMDPSSVSPPTPRPSSGMLSRPASRVFGPFAGCVSPGSGTITPMRIFDSPAPTTGRSATHSPIPSTTPSLADRHGVSRSARKFAPFPLGRTKQTKGPAKMHLCTVCNKNFARPSTLETHMNSHTGERPHICPVKNCGRRFSVPSNLRRHAKSHKSSKSKPMSSPPLSRKKSTAVGKEEPRRLRPRVLQDRKNVQSWCPESLRGMHNAESLSSRPSFEMLEGAVPLPTPLPAVRPRGNPGDENYEDRDSFFYARETDQPTPYHPLVWNLRPTLPGPIPSQVGREAGACGTYESGGTLSGLGTWVGDNHRA